MKKYTYILFLFFVFPFFVYGQSFGNEIALEVNPPNPESNTEVEIRLVSSSADLMRSKISWYLNDILQTEGVGIQLFRFTTGSTKDQSKIRVVIKTPEGKTFSHTQIFLPKEVDILWTAHSYVPPFYKGKTVASSRNILKLVAIPHLFDSKGNKISEGKLHYTWEQDGLILGKLSGKGKNVAIVQSLPVPGGKSSVTVYVSTTDNSIKTQKTIAIRTIAPFILFYEKHPLEGVRYEHSVTGTFSLNNEEITVRAEPYFFSIDDMKNKDMEYVWSLNYGNINPSGKNPRELVLRKNTEVSGTALVRLKIENINRLLQLAENYFSIRF